MQKPGNAFARGSELIVGLFVVAFIVFLLWVILLRPQTSAPLLQPTPTPGLAIPITDPNKAFINAIATPTPEPLPTETPTARPTRTPTVQVYVVQPGDTLSRIAELFGVTVDALIKTNMIVNPDALQVNQELTIPAP
ncbi:MAG: peptidoglycan-binding protein [Chloroflexi bacterium]|nr:peptidoglycan-binding protein [Chloroflexota bacterium]HCU72505.1 peptidoglycan-binding protein [Chloroflexota bacterium]|tara:strand:- start:3168 stop:3578 length:411 start_codon:yes stop_codon:yes gene_type:complete